MRLEASIFEGTSVPSFTNVNGAFKIILKAYLKETYVVSGCMFISTSWQCTLYYTVPDTVESDYLPFNESIYFRGNYSVGDTECVVVYITAPLH